MLSMAGRQAMVKLSVLVRVGMDEDARVCGRAGGHRANGNALVLPARARPRHPV